MNDHNYYEKRQSILCGITIAVMELKLVNSQDPCRLFRPDELCPIYRVQFLQAYKIYAFNGVLSQAGDFRNLLQRIGTAGQKIPCVLV